MSQLPERRLLLVHAHPDDESICNGATMAKYVAEGAHVTLVTCTLGEEGEIIPSDLAHLGADREDTLGRYRLGELASAMRELGVRDHRILGGPGCYRDSGMMGVPQNTRPGSFWQADPETAAPHLVEIVRGTRPQVLVTYGPDGGYGHPDHIRAHQVAMRAAVLAADPAYRPDLGGAHTIAKVYWNCVPVSHLEAALEPLVAEMRPFPKAASPADVSGVVADDEVTTVVDGRDFAGRKAAAMRAHATQIEVREPYFALSNGLGQPIMAQEFYRLACGEPGADSMEDDLFAGLGE